MNKRIIAKIIGIVILLLGMVGANTVTLDDSTNASSNNYDTEFEIGTSRNQAPNGDPVVAGAGDIARCSMPQAAHTAALLGNINGDVITFGDNTQVDGTAVEFANCYDPTWGLYKYKTHPSPGNHDYNTSGALPYYEYFGSVAGEAGKGYYSYDIGYWHLIALNSQVEMSSNSPQAQWLQADLDLHQNNCTLAYWHRPRFTSGLSHPSDTSLGAIWEILYEYGVDVVLNGHVHLYERFAPQDPKGIADPNGIREFVVGTGGGGSFVEYSPIVNSEVINNQTYGVIKLTLHKYSYDWEFIPIEGQTFTDSGSDNCSIDVLYTYIPLIGKYWYLAPRNQPSADLCIENHHE